MKRASGAYNLELYKVFSLSNRGYGVQKQVQFLVLVMHESSIAQATTL